LLLEFVNATTDGFRSAVKNVGQIKQTAASQFGRFRGGIEATVSFIQGVKEVAHRRFRGRRICCLHDGVLPRFGVSASCNSPRLMEKRRAEKIKRGS
jgi:hypothetical protein